MQTIYLDISNKGVIPCIQAKQNEVGRKFLAIITDNGVPYNIKNDSLLSVWYEGDTDAGNYSSIEEKSAFQIDGNKVSVELVAQMLMIPGDGEMCLSISHGDGGETNTWNIPYSVEYKPGAGSAVPTEYYTALTNAAALAATQVGLAKDQADIAITQATLAKQSEANANEYATSAAESAATASEAAKNAAQDVLVSVPEEVRKLAQVLFPVGYVFSWDSVAGSDIDLSTAENVANHFGFGTWEQVKDVFLLSAGDTYSAGSVGGSATHTLTIDEMPSHGHRIKYNSFFSGAGIYSALRRNVEGDPSIGDDESALPTGGDQPFSIMPPYKSVYVWKRIA